MKEYNTTITLSPENIDQISSELVSYLESVNTKSADITNLRLNIEEVLLRWRDSLGENAQVVVQGIKVLGQRKIVLSVSGDECNPLKANDEFGIWMNSLVSRLENTPSYTYSHKTNITSYKVPRKKFNPFVLLSVAVISAIVIGSSGRLLSADLRLQIANDVLAPVCNSFINILCFCDIPLIFLSICLGIMGIGDIHAFSQIGLGLVKMFMTFLFISALMALCLALPFFDLQFGQSSITWDISNILSVIISWVPTNLFVPFIDCNAMQLIIMGIVFGIGILKLDNKGKNTIGFFNEMNNLMLMVSEWLTKLIPVFVFITIIESVLKSDAAALLHTGRTLLITTFIQTVFVILLLAYVCIKNRIKAGLLVKNLLGLFLISLGTNSCSASASEHYNSSVKIGIPEKIYSFGIPIGMSVFKPATAIRYMVLAFFMTVEYNLSIAPSWLIMVVFVCIILSIASPGIPGGALLLYPMLFSQLGIPAEAITMMLATDIFFDAICTSLNQISVQLILTDFSAAKN